MTAAAFVIPFVRQTTSLVAMIDALSASPDAHLVLIHDPVEAKPGRETAGEARRYDEGPIVNFNDRLTVINNTANAGYTRSVNRAAAWALANVDCSLLWLVNDDVAFVRGLPSPPDLPARTGLVGILSNRAGYQSLAYSVDDMGDYLYPERDAPSATAEFEALLVRAKPRLVPVPLVHGFCFGVTRRCAEAIGLLDDTTFALGYGSDYDMSLRAQRAGYTNFVHTGSFAWHAGAASAGRVKRRIHAIRANVDLRRIYGEEYKRAKFVTRTRLNRRLTNFTALTRD